MRLLVSAFILVFYLVLPCYAVLRGSAVESGGSLLVGDDTVSVTDQTTTSVSGGDAFGHVYTAVSSGTSLKGYARIRAVYSATNCKFIIADSDGVILGISDPVSIDVTYSNVEFDISGVSISTGVSYKLAVIAMASIYPAYSGTWGAFNQANNYTTPTTILGDNGSAYIGTPLLWVED